MLSRQERRAWSAQMNRGVSRLEEAVFSSTHHSRPSCLLSLLSGQRIGEVLSH